jgi:Zn-finger protein
MSYKRFTNYACEYYPCHSVNDLNCLFCFCPLYHLNFCPGEFTYTDKGIKDCSKCEWIHKDTSYDVVVEILKNETNKNY